MILMTIDMVTASHNRLGIIQTFKQLIGPTEARAGCRGCRLLQDLGSENRLLYLELWECESELKSRIGSSSFMKVLALMELSTQQPELMIRTINRTRGLETIELIRQKQAAPRGKPKQDAAR